MWQKLKKNGLIVILRHEVAVLAAIGGKIYAIQNGREIGEGDVWAHALQYLGVPKNIRKIEYEDLKEVTKMEIKACYDRIVPKEPVARFTNSPRRAVVDLPPRHQPEEVVTTRLTVEDIKEVGDAYNYTITQDSNGDFLLVGNSEKKHVAAVVSLDGTVRPYTHKSFSEEVIRRNTVFAEEVDRQCADQFLVRLFTSENQEVEENSAVSA